MTLVEGQIVEDGDVYGYLLPVDYDKGFPQSLFTTIKGVVFHVTYRFSSIDDSLILQIIRARDGQIVFVGKISQYYDIMVFSPLWHLPYFILVGKSVIPEDIEIYVFPPID